MEVSNYYIDFEGASPRTTTYNSDGVASEATETTEGNGCGANAAL